MTMRQISNRDIEEARDYHAATKHSYWSVRSGSHFLDWENKPLLYKVYPDLPVIPLPRDIDPPAAQALEAVSAFEEMIANYPESPLVDDARFQIAMASLKGTFTPGYDQSPTDHAVRELQAFQREYPASELLEEATMKLHQLKEQRAQHEFLVGEFYERRKRLPSAKIYYDTVLQSYADTSWAPKAAAKIEILQHRLP